MSKPQSAIATQIADRRARNRNAMQDAHNAIYKRNFNNLRAVEDTRTVLVMTFYEFNNEKRSFRFPKSPQGYIDMLDFLGAAPIPRQLTRSGITFSLYPAIASSIIMRVSEDQHMLALMCASPEVRVIKETQITPK